MPSSRMAPVSPDEGASLRLPAATGERTRTLTELASGVDALYVSGRAEIPPAFLERLEKSRDLAGLVNGPAPMRIADIPISLLPHGFGRYRYCLRHRHGQVGLTPSTHLPAIRIQPRTEFLQAVGPRAAIGWFLDLLAGDVGPIRPSVARLDLFADFQGWALRGDDRHRFVVRGRELDTYEDGDALSGFVFGRRTTGTVLARIYDKQPDVRRTGADWWHDVWGSRYDASRPVHRVEFELGRQGLKEYGVETPDDAIDAAGALWASLTDGWLTYRSPTADASRSRWPVAPEWRCVQHASIRNGAAGAERIAAGQSRGDLRLLMPRLVGELASFAAIVGTEHLSDTMVPFVPAVHEHLARHSITFEEKVAERHSRRSRS